MAATKIRVPFGTCNARKELGPADAWQVVALAITHAWVIGWQEIETRGHKKAIHAISKHGFMARLRRKAAPLYATYWPGRSANAVPISWRRDMFELIHCNKHLMNKGRRGKWPDRWAVLVILRHRKTGVIFGYLNGHMIPMAFTSHPERQDEWHDGEAVFAETAHDIVKHFENLLGGLDANAGKYHPEDTNGAWANHGTHGRAYYDSLIYAGNVTLVGKPVRYAANNPSDHDLLVATAEITGGTR